MKTTETIKNYRAMEVEQLQAELLRLKKDLSATSLKIKAGKMSDFAAIDKIRKNIARVSTIISEKETE